MTNHPTPVILDEAAMEEIEAREAKASSGPWLVTDGQHIDQYAPHPEGNRLLSEGSYDSNYHMFGQDDVEFIAHARTDIPALCATVRALREQLAESDAIIKSYNDAEWKTNTALREQLAGARIELQVVNGDACKEEQDAGNGPCGICRTCLQSRLAQVKKDLELARQSLLQMTTAVENRS